MTGAPPSRYSPAMNPRRAVRALLVAVIAVASAPGLLARPAIAITAAVDDKPKPARTHTHTWVKQTKKEWVPPQKQRVQVGVDAKGKPVYETKIVKPGYWRTVVTFRCGCGATKS